MSIRRTFQIAVVTLALGAAAPMLGVGHAQNVPPSGPERSITTSTSTADDRGDRGPNLGWIGIFGLAGLAGLLGNRRETHDYSRNPSTTTAPVR